MERLFVLGLVLAIVIVRTDANGQEYLPRPPGHSICNLPPDTGLCKGYCPRYYHDSKTGTCQRFIYGCCGGNANNFRTKELCNRVCKTRFCPAIACLIGPCTSQKCPAFPEAICVAVCPCMSVWIYDGEDVTDKCNNKG